MVTTRIASILIAAVFVSTSCSGEQDLSSRTRERTTQAALPGLPPLDVIAEKIPDGIKTVVGAFLDLGAAFSKAKEAVEVTKFLLQLLEIIPKTNPDAKLDALKEDVAKATMGISWQSTLTFIDGQRGHCVDAINGLIRDHGQLAEGSTRDANCGSAAAAIAGTSPIASPKISGAFFRPFSEIVTDGLWKQVVPDRPPVGAGTLVYDWRLGAPALMEIVAFRLQTIAAMDPNFRWGSHFRFELQQLRDSLLMHYDVIRKGIRCASDLAQQVGVGHICADIYTGAYTRQPMTSPAADANTAVIYERLASRIKQKMPLFEMRSLIDALNLYINAQQDITDGVVAGALPHRIVSPTGTDQCLDLPTGDPNFCPLGLPACSGATSENWVYDRKNGTMINLASQQCLAAGGQVVAGVFEAILGASVWGAPCSGGNEQKWTYDPSSQRLQNALGTVLEAQQITPDTGPGNICGPAPWRVSTSKEPLDLTAGPRWAAPQTCRNVCVAGDAIRDGASGGNSCNQGCAHSICAQDPFCCQEAWDGLCVAEVTSVCGLKCN